MYAITSALRKSFQPIKRVMMKFATVFNKPLNTAVVYFNVSGNVKIMFNLFLKQECLFEFDS